MERGDKHSDWPFGWGMCHCGCNGETPLAARTDALQGRVKGEPVKLVNRYHHQNSYNFSILTFPIGYPHALWPHGFGLCSCGCRQQTATAKDNRATVGYIKGQPRPWISGHQGRKTPHSDKPGYQICAQCEQEQEIEQFTPVKGHAWRRSSNCKTCVRKRAAAWYEQNKDKRRQYVMANVVKRNSYQAARRGRELNHPDSEFVDFQILWERDEGVCYLCHEQVESIEKCHMDHVVPVCAGGPTSYANMRVTHASCNTSKGAKTLDGYRQWQNAQLATV